jgi:hypothetical protein
MCLGHADACLDLCRDCYEDGVANGMIDPATRSLIVP